MGPPQKKAEAEGRGVRAPPSSSNRVNKIYLIFLFFLTYVLLNVLRGLQTRVIIKILTDPC